MAIPTEMLKGFDSSKQLRIRAMGELEQHLQSENFVRHKRKVSNHTCTAPMPTLSS